MSADMAAEGTPNRTPIMRAGSGYLDGETYVGTWGSGMQTLYCSRGAAYLRPEGKDGYRHQKVKT